MEWLTSIRTAIDYMENHLEDNMNTIYLHRRYAYENIQKGRPDLV